VEHCQPSVMVAVVVLVGEEGGNTGGEEVPLA